MNMCWIGLEIVDSGGKAEVKRRHVQGRRTDVAWEALLNGKNLSVVCAQSF